MFLGFNIFRSPTLQLVMQPITFFHLNRLLINALINIDVLMCCLILKEKVTERSTVKENHPSLHCRGELQQLLKPDFIKTINQYNFNLVIKI